MPPKKAVAAVAALAKSIKNGVSKKSTDKSATAKKSTATKAATVKKPAATKSATAKKPAATKNATAKKSDTTKSVTAKKSATKTKSMSARDEPKPRANISRKRKTTDREEENEAPATKKTKTDTADKKRKATEDAAEQPAKRAKSAIADSNASQKKTTAKAAGRKPVVPKALTLKIGTQINFAPTQPLDIFIFGEGESGELGLGNKKSDGKKPVGVKRPRLHHLLPAKDVGVVQLACGGMHSIALAKDNKILTWGVNDQGALGRDTAWDGGVRDADADESEDESEEFENMNPLESTPAEVNTKNIAPGIKFVKVVASDSASFALTEDGRVYGWGTFRVSRLPFASFDA